MNVKSLSRCILIGASLATILCLVLWVAVPFIQMAWELLFPNYGHKVAVLPYDVECYCQAVEGSSQLLVLPKGLMIYSPCSHDYSRMSLDEKATYKIYLKLDAKTIKALFKDSDREHRKAFLNAKRFGEIEEIPKQGATL